jgi:hypothetical protein
MKKILLILLALLPCITLAQTSFNEQFDVEPERAGDIADRVMEYRFNHIEQDNKARQSGLENLQKEIEQLIKTSPDDPLLRFLSGLNHASLASLYAAQDMPQMASYYSELRTQDYVKAIELDKTQPKQLNAKIYAAIKPGLPPDARIKAIEQELTQGGGGDNEDYYWQLHWSHVSALDEAKRYDEAEQALQTMQQEMKDRGVTNPDYQIIVDKARNSIQQHRNATPAGATNSAPASSASASVDNKNLFEKYPFISWILFGLAILTVVIVLIVQTMRK